MGHSTWAKSSFVGDCQGVLRGIQRLLHGKSVRKNAPHSDLWAQMQAVLASGGHLIELRKVVSHGDIQQATGPLEEWAYWHNALTDMAADGINQRRPAAFWQAWEGLRSALTFHRQLHLAILRLLVQTSRVAVTEQQPRPTGEVAGPQVVVPRQMPQQWSVSAQLVRRYGQVNMDHLHDWWTTEGIQLMQGSSPLVYVSGIQLFFMFNLCTGYIGPWCHSKRWFSTAEAAPEVARTSWGTRSSLFLRMWRSYLKSNKVLLATKMARPASAALSKWGVCYRLRCPQALVDLVDGHIFSQLGKQVSSQRDICELRAAKTG